MRLGTDNMSFEEEHGLGDKHSSHEKALRNVRTRKIRGQTNYIVGGHYFNDKAGAHHFAKTGKTLKNQHGR